MTGYPSTPARQADLAPAPATASGANQTALPPERDVASARVNAGVEAPDPEAIATLHIPDDIGGDVTHHITVLRQIWWQHHGLGFRYPAEPGIIVIDGGKSLSDVEAMLAKARA